MSAIVNALREREARFTDDVITGSVDDPLTFYSRNEAKVGNGSLTNDCDCPDCRECDRLLMGYPENDGDPQ